MARAYVLDRTAMTYVQRRTVSARLAAARVPLSACQRDGSMLVFPAGTGVDALPLAPVGALVGPLLHRLFEVVEPPHLAALCPSADAAEEARLLADLAALDAAKEATQRHLAELRARRQEGARGQDWSACARDWDWD